MNSENINMMNSKILEEYKNKEEELKEKIRIMEENFIDV